ncbi:MAG: DUF983 domain-containing protein [Alphaproteobacteria bacterium]|nr:DUF983 domain-containing protein [Alphaproteobacteria bacterium]
MAPIRWQPDRVTPVQDPPLPPLLTAVGRGLLGRCPSCGQTHLFNGYLKVVSECRNCGAPLGSARADDAPPYFTILIVGHIIVPIMFLVDRHLEPPLWLMAAIFLPLTLALTLALLRPIKGGTVGLMLKLGMVRTADD